MMAAPIGVSPVAERCGGWKLSTVWKSETTWTGPKVTIANSTRLMASASAANSSLKATRPLFNSVIGEPCIEWEVSSNSRHGQRRSGLSAKSFAPNGTWSRLVITLSPHANTHCGWPGGHLIPSLLCSLSPTTAIWSGISITPARRPRCSRRKDPPWRWSPRRRGCWRGSRRTNARRAPS